MVGGAAAGTGLADILVAGLAGLVVGAMSMAAGEYVSVSSQADTEQADLARERHEPATALALPTVLGAVAARVGGGAHGARRIPGGVLEGAGHGCVRRRGAAVRHAGAVRGLLLGPRKESPANPERFSPPPALVASAQRRPR
jgi:hypothetical protein